MQLSLSHSKYSMIHKKIHTSILIWTLCNIYIIYFIIQSEENFMQQRAEKFKVLANISSLMLIDLFVKYIIK